MKHKIQALYSYISKLPSDKARDIVLDEVEILFSEPERDNTDSFRVTVFNRTTKSKIVSFHINSYGGVYQSDDIDVTQYIEGMLQETGLAHEFPCAISVKELDQYPENCNPFLHDLFSMGADISGGWMAMHSNHFGNDLNGRPHPEPQTIVLVNVRTGRRFELDMTEANKPVVF